MEIQLETFYNEWGDLHIWSPAEIRDAGLDYREAVRFGKRNKKGVHKRRTDEIPTGINKIKLCSMQEARLAWYTQDLPYYQVSCYITRIRGVEYNGHNIPQRDGWGERWGTLIPEPTNRFDPFAISVEIDGKRIGYISESIAERFQWVVRALMADNYTCIAPCFIEHFDSIWITLPTAQTWEKRYNLDNYYKMIRNLWDSIPEDVALAEIHKPPDHPSEEAAKELWKLRDTAPQFFSTKPGAENFPIVWHQVFQEVRTDYWATKSKNKQIEHEKLNKQIVDLYSTGIPMTAVAKELNISEYQVRKGLIESNIKIDQNRSRHNVAKTERDNKIVQLYQSGLSQYSIAKQIGLQEKSVHRILLKQGVEIRKHSYKSEKERSIENTYISNSKYEDKNKKYQTLPKKYFEHYAEIAMLAAELSLANQSPKKIQSTVGYTYSNIEQLITDGLFYKYPLRYPNRLSLVKKACSEHWTKKQAKEMGQEFLQAVKDRKVMRKFHPELLK